MVDDCGSSFGALEGALAPLGHRLARASSAEQALRELAEEEFAVAILHLKPPVIDAFRAAAQIRSRPRTRKLPIIFVANTQIEADDVARAMSHGVDLLVLPCDPRVVRARVAVFVDWYLQTQEHRQELAAIRHRDRKRYEEQTAHRVRNLTDLMPLCVWAADVEGRITYVNQSFAEYTGVDAQEANDRGLLEVIHADDRAQMRAAWAEAVRTGEQLIVEFRLRRGSDGAYRWHLGRAVPERSAVGTISGWIATATDIHDQKEAQERMSELADRAEAARALAEQASRTKDQFLATVSHELRTPLNAIYGWTRMLRSGELPSHQLNRALQTIERNTRAQIRLIEDLLDVSRIVSGKMSLDFKTVAATDIVRTAVEAMLPAAHEKGVEVMAAYDPAPHRISADPNRLQQVVWNLVTNAIKFTPSGGRVDVIVTTVAGQLQIEVNDSGHGIAPEFLPYVFDPFRQADGSATRAHGGLGLGLAIVKHIIERHGGSVDATSDGYGRGARFVVRLPISDGKASDVTSWPSPSSNAFARVRDLGEAHILVVDDDDDSREMLAMIFESYGASVARAGSAAQAWEAIACKRPDVLLSDIGMPGEDGHSLIRRVREADRACSRFLPAIALTGFASVEDGNRALAAGFQLHVTKPVDPAELLILVSRLLAGAPAEAIAEERTGRRNLG